MHTDACTHMDAHTRTYTHTHEHIHTHTHTHEYTCTHEYTHALQSDTNTHNKQIYNKERRKTYNMHTYTKKHIQ